MYPSRLVSSLILAILISTFTIYFGWYAIQRYQTLNAYTADLSLIDQAIWNTAHGHFLEATWGNRQQPRLAEHFEPILIPLSLVYWVWDDVRAILVIQTFALAMGAMPVFWLARDILSKAGFEKPLLHLCFPTIYLLSPSLQAAAVADFHADPLMVAPLLFAFWYAVQKQWGWLWFWAIIVMLAKENMPTLVVMLGGYLVWMSWWNRNRWAKIGGDTRKHGIGLIVVGLLWFLVATFLIVAPLARLYFGSEGPIYLTNRFTTDPLTALQLLHEPARIWYVIGLVATTGGLALFAPQYLLLGLPIWVANVFSNFPGQYSGEQHYSAPLVAVVMIAAIYGARNLIIISLRISPRAYRAIFTCTMLVVFIISLFYQLSYGWTPFSRRAEIYAETEHVQIAAQLLAQIPAGVPISASAGLNPHLAHRQVAYTYPNVEDATYLLVDVTDVPGLHPNDVKYQLENLLASGKWLLLDAIDGFLLLQQVPTTGQQITPDSFYSFARTLPPVQPQYPLNLTFANQIQLLGFDLLDDPFHQQTSLRFYWQALSTDLADTIKVWPLFFDNNGQVLNHPPEQPDIASVWYPPHQWKLGEVVITESLPLSLRSEFHLAVAVTHDNDFADPSQRLSVATTAPTFDDDSWAQVATFTRTGWKLQVHPPQPTLHPLTATHYTFENGLRLIGLYQPQTSSPNQPMPIIFAWQAKHPINFDYTLFIHFIDADDNVVAQIDSQPFWLAPQPMTRWQPQTMVLSSHVIPEPLPRGTFQIWMGLYNWQTLARLPLQNKADSIRIGTVVIK